MKAALASEYGPPDVVLSVHATHPKPQFPKKVKKKQGGYLLVQVQACSLSPGDVRTITGEKQLFTKSRHAHGFPYIPGGDICGVVTDVSGPVGDFKVGDSVVVTWDLFGEGGLAEFAVVSSELAVHKPENISPIEGASLANSAAHALKAVEAAGVTTGSRVLVLGGSGGVGSMAVQFAKNAGASFVAATSTDEALLKSLGADTVVAHTTADWSQVAEFRAAPFDAIIDCAEGVRAWQRAANVLKRRGTFVAVVLGKWEIDVSSWFKVFMFIMRPLLRRIWAQLLPFGPRYKMYVGSVDGRLNARVMAAVAEGKVRAVVDRGSPLPFTEEGVKEAFRLQGGRKGHGKIVVQIT
jgi:NADPH:quinone reductase-like Zn-dependent oxidoreductase